MTWSLLLTKSLLGSFVVQCRLMSPLRTGGHTEPHALGSEGTSDVILVHRSPPPSHDCLGVEEVRMESLGGYLRLPHLTLHKLCQSRNPQYLGMQPYLGVGSLQM